MIVHFQSLCSWSVPLLYITISVLSRFWEPFDKSKGRILKKPCLTIMSQADGFLITFCFTPLHEFVICLSGFYRILHKLSLSLFFIRDIGCLLSAPPSIWLWGISLWTFVISLIRVVRFWYYALWNWIQIEFWKLIYVKWTCVGQCKCLKVTLIL